MRVLIINKFLYPNGGSETYIFKLGEALEQHGHEVQYFGMEHEGRCVGNWVNAYTSGMQEIAWLMFSCIAQDWIPPLLMKAAIWFRLFPMAANSRVMASISSGWT